MQLFLDKLSNNSSSNSEAVAWPPKISRYDSTYKQERQLKTEAYIYVKLN